jgi:formylglycine-generating enzyme required for sulfatase activity
MSFASCIRTLQPFESTEIMKLRSVFVSALIISTGSQSTAWARSDTPAAQRAPSSDLDARIKALIAKVKSSLRPLKGGTFEMGDWGTESGQHYDIDTWSRPLHKVTLDGFSMMAYKVTYEDFDVFTDAAGKERINTDKISVRDRAPKRPAGVSWYGAKAYCKWLGKISKLPFDLPTEAQWEFAARSGGKRNLFATDNGRIERPRNFPDEWKRGAKRSPLPDVGSYPPNSVGLYGMSENTREWVQDWFQEDYYKTSPEKNPTGPLAGKEKVMRGSTGGTAEVAAMVFMRTKAVPQPLESNYLDGAEFGKREMVPFPGYSSSYLDNFRCVVNSLGKID